MGRTKGSINKPKKLHKDQATIHRYTTGQLPSAVPVEERRESIIRSTEATLPCNSENSTSRSISDKVNGERNCTSADASPENDHITLEVLMREVEGDTRSNADETTIVDDDPMFRVDEPTGSDEDLVEAESAVLKKYFSDLQERFKDDTSKYGMPGEYCRGSFWVEPPAPFFALRNQEDIDPTPLYYPRVFLWNPRLLLHEGKKLRCPICNTEMGLKGYNKNPYARRILDIDSCFYIMSMRYKCNNETNGGCKKRDDGKGYTVNTVNAHDPQIIEQLPRPLASEFPAILTYRGGISKTLAKVMRPCIQSAMGVERITRMLREMHTLRHSELEFKYLSAALYRHENPTIKQVFARQKQQKRQELPEFSAFDDPDGFAGYIPSTVYLRLVYTAIIDQLRAFMDREMTYLGGEILKGDHTFRFLKKMAKMGQASAFGALYTVCNEYEEIRLQVLAPTKAQSHLKGPFEEMMRSYRLYGHPEPKIFFTDNVKGDRRFLESVIPSLKPASASHTYTDVNQVNQTHDTTVDRNNYIQLPSAVSVELIRDETDLDDKLLAIIDDTADNTTIVVGFDCEWNYVPGSGSGRVATVQVAYKDRVLLIPISKYSRIPRSFVTILHSPLILKAGRGVTGDLNKLQRDYGLRHIGALELGSFCSRRGLINDGRASLSTISSDVLHRPLNKVDRLSDWEVDQLTDSQIYYAALDAWVSLQIYIVAKGFDIVGCPITLPVQPGACVALCPNIQGDPIAYGEIDGPISDTPLPGSLSIIVKVNKVIIPGAILETYDKALGNFGDVPFSIAIPIAMLRAEKKAFCSPPPVIATTSTESEQESEPHDSESILPTSTDYISSDDGCSSDGDRSSLSSGDDGDYPNTTSQASPSADDMVPPLPHVNTAIPYTDNIDHKILKDIFHLMDMIKISRRHTLAKEFTRRFRDAVFVPDKEDRRKVEAYLEKNGITWDEMLCTNPSWVLRRVRRVVPPPQELYPKVDKLFNDYGNVVCWKTKRKLFDDDTWHQKDNVLNAIAEGQVSDPPGISLYFLVGHDKKSNLPIYRCVRGTNSLEGGVHQNIVRKIISFGASPHMVDCALADYRLRHNTDVGTRNRYKHEHKGHYSPWLTEAILTMRKKLNMYTGATGAVVKQSGMGFPGVQLVPSQETYGITKLPRTLMEKLGIRSGINQEVENDPRSLSSLDASTYTILPKGSTARHRGERYHYLKERQGTQYAVTPVHTQDEIKKYRDMMGDDARAIRLGWDEFAKQWNIGSNCEDTGKAVDGITVFYKTPDHLKTYHSVWSDRRAAGFTIKNNSAVCNNMRNSLQSPSRGVNAEPPNKPQPQLLATITAQHNIPSTSTARNKQNTQETQGAALPPESFIHANAEYMDFTHFQPLSFDATAFGHISTTSLHPVQQHTRPQQLVLPSPHTHAYSQSMGFRQYQSTTRELAPRPSPTPVPQPQPSRATMFRSISPAFSNSGPSEPLFKANVVIPRKRARSNNKGSGNQGF